MNRGRVGIGTPETWGQTDLLYGFSGTKQRGSFPCRGPEFIFIGLLESVEESEGLGGPQVREWNHWLKGGQMYLWVLTQP